MQHPLHTLRVSVNVVDLVRGVAPVQSASTLGSETQKKRKTVVQYDMKRYSAHIRIINTLRERRVAILDMQPVTRRYSEDYTVSSNNAVMGDLRSSSAPLH